MEKITIYHNPRCSKSRQALEILQNKGFEPIIIEYLKAPLDLEQLKRLRTHLALEDWCARMKMFLKNWVCLWLMRRKF